MDHTTMSHTILYPTYVFMSCANVIIWSCTYWNRKNNTFKARLKNEQVIILKSWCEANFGWDRRNEGVSHIIGLWKSQRGPQLSILSVTFLLPFFFFSSSQLHIYRSLNQQHPWIVFISHNWDLILKNQTDCKLSPRDAFWHHHFT